MEVPMAGHQLKDINFEFLNASFSTIPSECLGLSTPSNVRSLVN